ncbi:hotdog fold thioesterase [Roseivirga sp. BDSF3-8]|uniref:hotdog fold thioesterase n=1 Tax=Roseivirga sp. BDSF3-8 TaxID=3241598 RepID=UPI0035321F39
MIPADVTTEKLNAMSKKTMVEHLGIEFSEVGKDYLKARMPVDNRTVQPFRLLHGGASVALAETLGSVGAHCLVNPETHNCVGLEINANHIRAARNGWVIGTARPLHIGRTTQVWEIKIEDEEGKLVCISRITMAILERK